jgi:hypothetical protein
MYMKHVLCFIIIFIEKRKWKECSQCDGHNRSTILFRENTCLRHLSRCFLCNIWGQKYLFVLLILVKLLKMFKLSCHYWLIWTLKFHNSVEKPMKFSRLHDNNDVVSGCHFHGCKPTLKSSALLIFTVTSQDLCRQWLSISRFVHD